MSKSEIQSWISSASTSGDAESTSDRLSWQRDRVLVDWERSLEYAQNELLGEKTKARVQFLQDELLSLAKHGGTHASSLCLLQISSQDLHSIDLNLSQIMDIFKLLTMTYPRYSDTTSREAVEAVGMELVRRDELRGTPEGPADENKLGVTEQILGWLSTEVARLSKRGSSRSDINSFQYSAQPAQAPVLF
jgi:hypothetical protein